MKHKKRFAIFFICVFCVIFVDQITKSLALREMSPEAFVEPRPILGNILQFYIVFNEGAAFSLGQSIPIVFVFLPIILIVSVILYLKKISSVPWIVALGVLCGGAAGNMADRWFRGHSFPGAVVDFLKFYNFFIFNIADVAVFSGVLAILFFYFKNIPIRKKESNVDENGS